MRHLSVLILCGLVTACSSNTNQTNVLDNSTSTLGYLEVPAGFSVEVFAEGVEGARQMALGENGIIYIGTRRTGENGKLYAVIDSDNDYKADEVTVIASGLRMPNGVAYKDGDLYVSEVSNIWRYDDIDQTYDQNRNLFYYVMIIRQNLVMVGNTLHLVLMINYTFRLAHLVTYAIMKMKIRSMLQLPE